VLRKAGVPDDRIHRELFFVDDEPMPNQATHVEEIGEGSTVSALLDGRTTIAIISPGTTVLDGMQRVRPDMPFACKGGVCGTCRAKVTDGIVEMRRNFALEAWEVAAGYVLTCQAICTTDTVTIDYDC
jgi:ring-1,2-phenylacetyl-CoA epoxidase subunit PaaE